MGRADKRRRAIRLRSACRPHGAQEAKRPQISGVYHWAGEHASAGVV